MNSIQCAAIELCKCVCFLYRFVIRSSLFVLFVSARAVDRWTSSSSFELLYSNFQDGMQIFDWAPFFIERHHHRIYFLPTDQPTDTHIIDLIAFNVFWCDYSLRQLHSRISLEYIVAQYFIEYNLLELNESEKNLCNYSALPQQQRKWFFVRITVTV